MGFTCRYLERKQNKTKQNTHKKNRHQVKKSYLDSVLLQFMLGNSDVTDKQVINVM